MFPILGTNLCLILDAENQLFRIMAHGHAKKFVPLWTQIVVNNLKIKDMINVSVFSSNCRFIKMNIYTALQIINPWLLDMKKMAHGIDLRQSGH